MLKRALFLVAIAATLTGCPPRNSSYEPAFPETESATFGVP